MKRLNFLRRTKHSSSGVEWGDEFRVIFVNACKITFWLLEIYRNSIPDDICQKN